MAAPLRSLKRRQREHKMFFPVFPGDKPMPANGLREDGKAVVFCRQSTDELMVLPEFRGNGSVPVKSSQKRYDIPERSRRTGTDAYGAQTPVEGAHILKDALHT